MVVEVERNAWTLVSLVVVGDVETETGERGTARSARMMLLSPLVVVVKTERYARRASSLLLSSLLWWRD